MDRITTIVRLQWRAYWRRVRGAGYLSRNNVGLLVLVGGFGAFRYFQQFPLVAAQLEGARTARYEMLLSVLFFIWMLPAMGESRRSISTRKLLHLPLTTLELFSIRLFSVFVSPVGWIVGLASFSLSYILSRARNPVLGIVALFLFLVLAISTSLVVTHLLSNASARKFLIVAAIVVFVALGVYWIVKGSVPVSLAQELPVWLPNKLASAVAVSSQPFRPLAALGGMTGAILILSFLTFRLGVEAEENRRSHGATILGLIKLPGRFGGLLKKDLRYSSRLLDLYLAVPIVVLFNIYLASNPAPSPAVFWTVVNLLFLPCVSLAFNGFGLDKPLGLDRYSLMPLSGREMLLSKNLSFALVAITLFSMIAPLAIWKLGLGVTVVGFLILALTGLAYLTWGNWLSVTEPFRMQFYRFASGGSPVDALGGILFGSLPGIIAVYFLNSENHRALWKLVVMMGLYFVLYHFSVNWSARKLESGRDVMRLRLS